ncbi:MAG: tRNA-cytidine(32) 2-sulfurtransferase [Chlamydiia bacterium]|nr:tRNA-cytidine(32) 2-sulfurtransferase [Chlamydiia bacterium]
MKMYSDLTSPTQTLLPIASPPWSKLGKRLEAMIRKTLYEHNLFEDQKKIGIALSGGKDSLTLLYLLCSIKGRGFPDYEIVCFHVSGKFSCGPGITTQFLESICKHLEVPLVVKHSDIEVDKLECYGCSRNRRRLLFEAAKEHGVKTIAFGHHFDDHVETGILNLFHKGEFSGMLTKLKMVKFGITIVRPLILFRESQIKEFAKQYGFNRITCQCPVGQTSKRKDVKKLITQIEKEFPHAQTNLFIALEKFGSKGAIKD